MSTLLLRVLDASGLEAFAPIVKIFRGEDRGEQMRKVLLNFGAPMVALAMFLGGWSLASQNIMTKYGALPSPSMVLSEGVSLVEAHAQSRQAEEKFLAEQKALSLELRSAASVLSSQGRSQEAAQLVTRADQALQAKYSGAPSYLDQIATSLKTVFTAFLVASFFAIPIGVLCGASETIRSALSPMIQILKPVSPLAWLPIVMIVVGALYTTPPDEAWFEKSFLSSALTVALCSLWPTLANTALGVASVDKDHLNVARVLKLTTWTKITKIMIPSALPMMFAGLRISLGVGWMVLIASEMLAQNPGLGKFVWDMFQNGSSQTLARIMVAVFTIGFIGMMLDRLMVVLERAVSYSSARA